MQRLSKKTRELRKAIVDEYYKGTPTEELSKKYNISTTTIRYVFLKDHYAISTYGYPPYNRKCKINTQQKEEMLQFYNKGETLKELAYRYEITPSYVSHLINRYRRERKERVLMNDQNRSRLIKYSKPTKFCTAPYKSQWLHLSAENQEDLFIQVSEDELQPDWKPIGYFLEKCFIYKLDNDEFMKECMILYHNNTKEISI